MEQHDTIFNSYRGASFSADRRYRFLLWRFWGEGRKLLVIGLNPSTANEITDDPTVRRCIAFAKDWGFDGLFFGNLFGLVSADPAALREEPDSVGLGNDLVLRIVRQRPEVEMAVAAWGNLALWSCQGLFHDRWERVTEMLAPLWCFGITMKEQPKHPLYLKKTTSPILWRK